MADKSALIIFLKYPVTGRVKTRLGQSIGMEKAAEIYKELAKNIIYTCHSEDYDTFLCIDPTEPVEKYQEWLGEDNMFILQKGTDLGERMLNAFKAVFSLGYDKCALTGSDIANMTNSIVNDAFRLLDIADCVTGPSEDGGYYLIAFNNDTLEPSVFFDMIWSTDSVLNITEERLAKSGKIIQNTVTLYDVDCEDDLRRYREKG